MNIYDQHQTAFRSVSAFLVLDKSGDVIARVAFKHGGSCICYFHILGQQMARGRANGGGYDRASAAAYNAAQKIAQMQPAIGIDPALPERIATIARAMRDDGNSWDRSLRDAGFQVLQAV